MLSARVIASLALSATLLSVPSAFAANNVPAPKSVIVPGRTPGTNKSLEERRAIMPTRQNGYLGGHAVASPKTGRPTRWYNIARLESLNPPAAMKTTYDQFHYSVARNNKAAQAKAQTK